MTRGNARELAVHLIYSQGFTHQEPEQEIAIRFAKDYYPQLAPDNDVYAERPAGKMLRYVDTVVAGVANRSEELNAVIARYSLGWDVSRISRLARAVLQLAIFEMDNVPDVPTGVAISEAVRIAKKYDGDDTGAFVNGILGSYARSMEAGGGA